MLPQMSVTFVQHNMTQSRGYISDKGPCVWAISSFFQTIMPSFAVAMLYDKGFHLQLSFPFLLGSIAHKVFTFFLF